MKKKIRVSVQNVCNDYVHFVREVESDGSLQVPYDNLVATLLWLYSGLHVKVVIETANY